MSTMPTGKTWEREIFIALTLVWRSLVGVLSPVINGL